MISPLTPRMHASHAPPEAQTHTFPSVLSLWSYGDAEAGTHPGGCYRMPGIDHPQGNACSFGSIRRWF